MNSITIAGIIGRDAEQRFLQNGDPVCNFSVADDQGGKDKPTIWWYCALFGKRAESLSKYLVKGQHVAVSGNLTKRVWKDKEGAEQSALELRVSDVKLMGGKPQEQQQDRKRSGGGDKSDFSDDVPF